MKLLNLNLKAIGPFTDVVLDLSRGNHGLHVILGPNEAGKSSSLRALSYLFFGFPNVVGDDFLHKYDKLRVGATLRRSDGEELEILRRKANKDNLRAGDDSAVIKPELLAQFLGNLDQESFKHRFGIDHGRLRMAGEEIRAGKGQLGEMLFAAGAGLAGLRQVQQELQGRSDELFRPKGQNPRINAALSGLRNARTDQKEHQLPTEEWQRHDQALKLAEAQAEGLAGRIAGLRKERSRLDRLRVAIPLAARRRRLLEERAAHGDAPLLRDDFGKEARTAFDGALLAERTISHSEAAGADLAEQLKHVHPSPLVLEAGEQIEALQQRLGTVKKAESDRGPLDTFRKDKEHRARQILHELGRPADLDQAGEVRLRGDEPKIIRELGRQYAEPRGQLDLTRAAIVRHQELISDSERALAELPAAPDVSGISKALRIARKEGDLDAQLEKARTARTKARKNLDVSLARLAGWDRTAEELQRLPVPSKEALDRFEARFQAVEQRRVRAVDARAAAAKEVLTLEAQVRVIENSGDVPLEADLDAARQRRDLGWRIVRESWLNQSADPALLAAFLGEREPATALAKTFEESIGQADAIGDRLRRESTNVAQKAGWLSSIRKHAEEIESIDRELRDIDDERSRLDSDWAAATALLGDARGRSVAEVRGWLREREKTVLLVEKVQEAQEQVEPVESARSRCVETLRNALGERGAAASTPDEDLSEWIEQAESLIQEADDVVKRRDQLNAAIKTATVELAASRRSREEAQARLEEWQAEWAPKMRRLGLEADAKPPQAEEALAKIQELETVLHDHSGFVSRIKGIDRDDAEFRDDVGELAARVGLERSGAAAYDQARELSRLLKEHRAVEVKRANLVEQLGQEQAKLVAAREELESSRAVLARLCKEAGCDDPEELARVEERSRSRARIEDDLRTCEEELLNAAAGADLAEFTAEVEHLDPDELNAAHDRLGDETAALEDELKGLHSTIGGERAALARMDGHDRAAQADENAQAFLAQLQEDVARFAALRISSAVLRRAVERYRQKSQGPVVDRASALFADLTGGSFVGLHVDEDDDGRLILKGVRPDRSHVGVEGMSDGSHDQLYLALRLAGLETWLESNEPIPFVVDDVLMSFDDARAAAALKALAGLSRRTQVLFFTHHQRLAELARAELSPDDVFIQELPRRS